MIRKTTLFLFLLMMMAGCIEADKFTPDGTQIKETLISVKSPVLSSADSLFSFYWKEGDNVELYYAPLKKWNHVQIDGISSTKDTLGNFTSNLEWKNNTRSHIFYAFRSASSSNAFDSNSDPSALSLSLSNVQYFAKGFREYMISCGTALVRGDDPVIIDLNPSLPLVELSLTAENDITVKTLKLTTVGAGLGKGISGDYKMDIIDNSVNMRETKDNSVTIDFGEKGLEMKTGKTYKAYAVMLPAKLDGLKFSISGSTTISSLEISAYEATDLKEGQVQSFNINLVPGPIRQDYSFTASCGIMGTSTSTSSSMLGFQGGNKNSTTAVTGLEIAKSEVELEYIGGNQETVDAYWEVTCPDWIIPSAKRGKGAASIELTMLPNMKAISNTFNNAVTNLSSDETANTYIINEAGAYSFNAKVMGNGDGGIISGANFLDYNGNTITTANISAGTTAKVVWQYYPNMITDVKLNGSQIEFSTGSTLFPGNAVIALCDAAGKIIWSWQIWATEELGADDVITNANTNEQAVAAGKNLFMMMDRNLGALAKNHTALSSHPKTREGEIKVIQYTDDTYTIPTGESYTHKIYQIGSGTDSYYPPAFAGGIFYQWGRKDPLLSPYTSSARPGHINFDGENNEIAPFPIADGGVGHGSAITIDKAITNPATYYKPNGTTNWLVANNDYLWGNRGGNVIDTDGSRPRGSKTIYDPCPKGYMVAAIDAWTAFLPSNIIGGWDSRGGYTFKTNSSDSKGVFYTGSGSLSSTGSLANYTATTNYWSNSVTAGSNNVHQMSLLKTNVNNNLNSGRGSGFLVRCMKEK